MKRGDIVKKTKDAHGPNWLLLYTTPEIRVGNISTRLYEGTIATVIADKRNMYGWVKVVCPNGVGWTFAEKLEIILEEG